MLKSKVSAVWSLAAMALMVGAKAEATVQLELRPASQSEFSGQTVGVEVYAVANPAEPVGIINMVLQWDASILTLVGVDGTGAHPWGSINFPSGGLNSSFADGDAFLALAINPCMAASATPSGLFVTTLLFATGANTGTGEVRILSSLSGSITRVWNNHTLFSCGGQLVAITIGPAVNVTVGHCQSALQCNDGNFCTSDLCGVDGVCTHTPNYNEFEECCNPATGATMPISDGNDCTTDFCNFTTGQVTHTNKGIGAACGSQVQNDCTNPDTCDGFGNCLPNNIGNGAFCDDGDTCTQASSCQDGVCVGTNPLPNGTVCTDGLACTTGSGTCQNGKCVEPGSACSSSQFCIEHAECNKNGDCDSVPGSTCVGGFCTAGYACWECLPQPKPCSTGADCPAAKPCENGFCRQCGTDTGCLRFICSPSHNCQTIRDHAQCILADGQFCNGDEVCDQFGFCQPANPPVANCPPGLPVCDETNDVCVECLDSSHCPPGEFCNPQINECVECLINAHCNDGNSCNGIETCNTTTGECIPGTPVTCSQTGICTIAVCNAASGQCEPKPVEQVACSQSNPCPDPAKFQCGPNNFCFTLQSCTDGDGCTVDDSCLGGACVGSPPPNPGPINLELSPNQTTPYNIGQTIDIRLFAKRTSGSSGISVAEASILWDPVRMLLQSPGFVDPCTNHPGDPLNCPSGTYDWFASGFLSNFDPDGLNDDFFDGDAHYVAQIGPGLPVAPVSSATPLHVTTLKFTAQFATSAAGVLVTPTRCVSPGGTYTRAITGAGQDVTGTLTPALVRIRCTTNAQCFDNNPCTTEVCNLSTNFCEYSNVANGTACGNQTPQSECDLADACMNGVCNANPKPAGTACTDDGNQCTNDVCNGAGACTHPNKPAGTPCNDGLFCTIGETCNLGFCGGGAANNCNDGIPCTIDSCNESADVCEHTPVDSICNNNVFCDGVEFCHVTLGCRPGTPPDCSSDGIACTVNDFCDEAQRRCNGIPDDNLCGPTEICLQFVGCVDGSCPPPTVVSGGPRYLKVNPQPPGGGSPVKLFVTSSTWPCLGKYVGMPVDADMDGNGVMDSRVAKLVDDPGDAAELTPAQWTGGFSDPAQPGALFITGEDITPSDRIGPGSYSDTRYTVAAECGGILGPGTEAVMDRWCDSDDNGIINITDVQIGVLAFQGQYHMPGGVPAMGSTKASVDVTAQVRGCDPTINPIAVNFGDIAQLILGFQGRSYAQFIAALPPDHQCSLPCP